MSTDPHEPRSPRDPLIDAALTATEGGDVDWEVLRDLMPDERETIAELAVLTEAMVAQRALGATLESAAGQGAGGAEGGGSERAGGDGEATVGFRWGSLEVRRRVGTGSFGDVFVAWDPRLHREVALKLRRPGAVERSRAWLQEARRLARVRHPNIVTVHGADLHDGRAGMWMEEVRGRTLEERLRHEGPLGAREAALIGIELCGALAAVHGAGLVHGDVKTHNIMREGVPGRSRDAGRVVLMDFGSSHESASAHAPAPGTPLFTAPEVLAGGRPTPASDLWSLGVVLYRIVTGTWPVEATTVEELRAKLADPGPVPLRARRSELPTAFVAAVERALDPDPTRRWKDAAAFERELLGALGVDSGGAAEWTRRHRARRRAARWGWVAGALAVAAVLIWLGVTRGERAWMRWRMRGTPLVGTLAAEMTGPTANAGLGDYVINVGDINGDGHDDVVASAPGAHEHGEVYLLSPDLDPTLKPWLTLHGEHPGDGIGCAAAGDVNGDGWRDLVVSAVFHDAGGQDAGRVYVFFGGPHMDDKPDRIIDGTHPAQYFGWSVAVGDVNGDHVDDVIVGAPYDSRAGSRTGRAYVYFGGPAFDTVADLEVGSDVTESVFGITAAYAGDFNADGYGDFVIGAVSHPGGGRARGEALVYYGGPKLDDRPDLVLQGREDDEHFGAVRQQTGDVNGDGYADIAVASERGRGLERGTGVVRIYFGGPYADAKPDLELEGEHRGEGFGKWVDASRDLDGDGNADLLVTAAWADGPAGTSAGRAYVFLGGRRLDAVPDFVVDGPASEALLGWGGCIVRDHDPGHRIGGVLLGAKNDSRRLTQAGGLELFDLERWNILPAVPRDGWVPGGTATLHWTGSTRADVALSVDGGRAWQVVARNAGGGRVNTVRVAVPAAARGSVHVRLVSTSAPAILDREMALGAR